MILGDIADINYSAYFDRCYRSVVCPSVRLSVTLVHPAKAVGQDEMPFGRDTHVVVPSNIVLDRSPGPHGKGRFGQSEPPVGSDSAFIAKFPGSSPIYVVDLSLYALVDTHQL